MDEPLTERKAAGESLDLSARLKLESLKQLILAHKAEAACASLLLIMALNLCTAISRKSITNDEIVHIPAGYYHLVAGEFQHNNEHPPLVKMWAALPLLFIQPNEAPPTAAEMQGNFLELTWSYDERFWLNNKERFQTISFWARAIMVVLTLSLGILIFVYGRELFGARAALLAVALYSLEPTVLAHGRIVHTDIPAALAFLLFFFVLKKYFEARTLQRGITLGLVTGLALITKFSMIVLLPVLALLTLAAIIFAPRLNDTRKKILLHAGIVVCLVLLVINAAYRFQRRPLVAGDVRWVQMKSPETSERWLTFFKVGALAVPPYYLFGQYNVMLHNRDGHATSLLGHSNSKGWWYYFPVAFALKTSLPFLLISIVALGWSIWRLFWKKDKRSLWLLIPLLIYSTLSMTSHINVGIRHFLPAFPFLFIAGAALLDRLLRIRSPRHLATALVVVGLGWITVEALRAYPHYVPYMNQLASGRPRWWYLSDSNVEWGESASELATYLKSRGETKVRAALLGAYLSLGFYGVEYVDLFAPPNTKLPETNYVAIGASFLNGSTVPGGPPGSGRETDALRVNFFDQYRHRTPEAIIGNSIYLFRVP